MALDLGTLTGYLSLDAKQFDGVVDGLPDQLSGMGGALTAAAGIAVAGVGAALANGLMDAVERERLNDRLAASLNLSGPQAEMAGRVAGSLYAQAYGDSLEQVNDVLAGVMSSLPGMGDATEAELEGITASVLDMTAAFGVESDRITQIVGTLMTTGLAGSAQEGVDLLTATLQQVPVAVREDVLDATSEYSTYFAQLGLSGEQGMALLVQASDGGAIAIDKIGDALKELTIRATDGSAASNAAYEAMGMSASDMSNRILAGGESANAAFAEIVAGLQGIQDPTEQANAAIALFGTPLEDLGTGAIPDFLGSLSSMGDGLGDVAGAADAMGETLNGNAATSWEQLSRTWDSVVGQLGGMLLPALSGLTSWANENPAALQIVAIALGVLATALTVAAIAQWAMNSALLASPITWIILAVVALVAAFVWLAMNAEEVNAFMTEVWNGFIGWITGVIEGFIGWWNGVWEGFASWITGVWDGFVGWIVGLWNGFIGMLMDGGNAIANWWNGLWSGIGNWIVNTWNGFINWVMSIFLGYGQWLISTGQGIVSWWNGLWTGIGNFIRDTWNGFVNWVVGIFVGFISGLISRGQGIISWWTGLWSNVRSGAESAWNGIVSWISGVPGMITGALSGAATWLVNIGRNILDGLMSGLRAGWDRVVGWINSLGGGIIDTFASILGIHSPSRVFRAFGVNITEGLGLGLDDGQASIDARVRGLVDVPPASVVAAELSGSVGRRGASMAELAAAGGMKVIVEGNVGWSAEELGEAIDTKVRRDLTLADLREFVAVA